MSECKRRIAGWGLSMLVLGALVFVTVAQLRPTSAQEGDGAPAEPDPSVVPPLDEIPEYGERHEPFTPYPAGHGAVSYEDHRVGPPDGDEDIRPSRASVDDAQAFAEQNGYDVHQAWSAYSRQRAAHARVKAAEYESGTAGLGDVGVP